jgi:hypothetical protein
MVSIDTQHRCTVLLARRDWNQPHRGYGFDHSGPGGYWRLLKIWPVHPPRPFPGFSPSSVRPDYAAIVHRQYTGAIP